MLTYIQSYCKFKRENGQPDFPWLTVLVVNSDSGIPGSGQISSYQASDEGSAGGYDVVLTEIERVFSYPWSTKDYPEDFKNHECFLEYDKYCSSGDEGTQN